MMTAPVVVDPGVDAVETPQERATRRVDELARAVGSVLEVLAAIYRDEDWRYLHDRCGVPYRDFGAFVGEQLGGSASNARRYRQGVETLVAPLQELAGHSTRIPITPHDVAQLGQSGAKQVLAAAPGRLAGVRDDSARTAALRELIDSAIAERRSSPTPPASSDDADVLPPVPAAALPAAAPSASRPAIAPDEVVDDAAAERVASGMGVPARRNVVVENGDGPRDTPDAIDAGELRAALAVLRRVDPAAAANALPAADCAATARECVDAAQRLARLGQLLRVVQ